MCIVKTPKLPKATAASEAEKDPAIIRNPYLDGLDPASKALRQGRSALRIERSTAGTPSGSAAVPAALTITRPATPAASAILPPGAIMGGGAASIRQRAGGRVASY